MSGDTASGRRPSRGLPRSLLTLAAALCLVAPLSVTTALAAGPSGASAPATISGTIFDDVNGDGAAQTATQPGPDPGLAGAQVTLELPDGSAATDAGGAAVTSMVTDSTGHYSFTGIAAGDYLVAVTVPSGYVATTPDPLPVTVNGADTAGTDPAPKATD